MKPWRFGDWEVSPWVLVAVAFVVLGIVLIVAQP